MNIRRKSEPEMPAVTTPQHNPKARIVTIKEPRQDRSEFTLKCIIEAARAEILKSGARASLRDIAARAGVAASTVSERFATREILLEYVHEDDCQRMVGRLDAAIRRLTNQDLGPRETIYEAIREGFRGVGDDAPMALAFDELARAHPEVAKRRAAFINAQVDRLIATARAHFGLAWTEASTRATRHAIHVVTSGALIGASYGALGVTSPDASEEIARLFADLLVATLDIPTDFETTMADVDRSGSNEYSNPIGPREGAGGVDKHETQTDDEPR